MSDFFSEAMTRTRTLFEELEGASLVEVVGIVGASGASGARVAGEDFWTLSVSLDAWRAEDGDLNTQKLTLRKSMNEEQLDSLRERFRPYSVVRVRARIAEKNSFGSPQGLLEDVIGVAESDAELSQLAMDLQKPATFQDVALGTFTLDRALGWFASETVWNAKPMKLHLVFEEQEQVQGAMNTARSLFASQDSWHKRVGDFAVAELLKTKNESWLDEGEAEVAPSEFLASMELASISAYSDGSFEFWFQDGDLFWGHSILVHGTLADGPIGAEIAG